MQQSSFDERKKPVLNVIAPPGYEYDPDFFVRHANIFIAPSNNCVQCYGSVPVYSANPSAASITSVQPTKYLDCDPIRRPSYL